DGADLQVGGSSLWLQGSRVAFSFAVAPSCGRSWGRDIVAGCGVRAYEDKAGIVSQPSGIDPSPNRRPSPRGPCSPRVKRLTGSRRYPRRVGGTGPVAPGWPYFDWRFAGAGGG